MQVRDIMTRKFTLVTPDTTIQEAARLMRDEDFGFLPVGSSDHLDGTLTDRDMVVRALAEGMSADTPVEDILSDDVICVRDALDIDEAAAVMRRHQIRRLAVVDGGERMVGVVSVGDIARETGDDDLPGDIEQGVARTH